MIKAFLPPFALRQGITQNASHLFLLALAVMDDGVTIALEWSFFAEKTPQFKIRMDADFEPARPAVPLAGGGKRNSDSHRF
jgi:hypothetical protein